MNNRSGLILCLLAFSFLGYSQSIVEESGDKQVNSLMFNDISMADVARMMTEMTDLSVITSKDAAKVEVKVYLQNVSALTALQSICRSYGLLYRDLNNGIYQVITEDEFSKNSGVFNHGHVETIPILYPPVEEICEAIRNVFADRVVWIRPEDNNDSKLENIEGAFERMDQLSGRSQADNASSNGNSPSSSNNNSSTSSSQNRSSRNSNNSRNNSSNSSGSNSGSAQLLDIDSDKNHINSADGGTEQVKQSGLIFLSAMKSSNTMLVRSSDFEVIKRIKRIAEDLDRPTPQVLLEVKILSADITDSKEIGVNWLFSKGNVSGGLSSGDLGWSSPGTLINGSASFGNGSSAVFNYMTKSMNARLRFMEKQGRITTLATPTLLVVDNEASRIFTGSSSKFLDSVTPGKITQNDNTSVVTDPTPDILNEDIGTSLILTPKIHADRTVTLRILQDQSSFGDKRTVYDYPANSLGVQRGSVNVQDINRQSIVTTVVAKDCNVIAIGGLITEELRDSVTGIPFLKDIPWIGQLFRDTIQKKVRKELIILIRPQVILAPGETQGRSQKVIQRISTNPAINGVLNDKKIELRFDEVTEVPLVEGEDDVKK